MMKSNIEKLVEVCGSHKDFIGREDMWLDSVVEYIQGYVDLDSYYIRRMITVLDFGDLFKYADELPCSMHMNWFDELSSKSLEENNERIAKYIKMHDDHEEVCNRVRNRNRDSDIDV